MSTCYPHPSEYPARLRRANASQSFCLGSITELPECAIQLSTNLPLGSLELDNSGLSTWKPESTDDYVRVDEGLYLSTSVDARVYGTPRELRSSFVQWKHSMVKQPVMKKWDVDRECGICFELAVTPRRTRCCGNLFCSEHLIDWLGGDVDIAGSCPSCQTMCSISADTISLASPPKPTATRSYSQSTSIPNRDAINLSNSRRPSSSAVTSIHRNSSRYSQTCPSNISEIKSVADTKISGRASPPCAPSRPNTPCSAFTITDTADPREQLQFWPNLSNSHVPGFFAPGFFTFTSEDTRGILLLAALAICMYAYLT